jgi:hypothetical protein
MAEAILALEEAFESGEYAAVTPVLAECQHSILRLLVLLDLPAGIVRCRRCAWRGALTASCQTEEGDFSCPRCGRRFEFENAAAAPPGDNGPEVWA